MKTKVLSTIMAIVMIVTTLCCVVPVTAEESTAVCKNQTTGTEYDSLVLAISEADSGDTIVLLKSFTQDTKSHATNPEYNVFIAGKDLTLTAEQVNGQNAVTLTFPNGGLIVGTQTDGKTVEKGSLTVENINIVQATAGVATGNCQAFSAPRGGSTITYKNCNFTTDGTRGGTNGYFMASSQGGTMNFENCTFNFTHATDASPLFSVYSNQNQPFTVNMKDCTVNSASKATRGFALCTALKVYLSGTNTFNTDGVIFSQNSGSNLGGTVHVSGTINKNEKATLLGDDVKKATLIISGNDGFDGFAQPVMNEGATLRVNGNSYGLRFTSTVAAAPAGFTTSYGTIIAKKATFDGELTSTDWYNATNMIGHEQMLTIRALDGKTTDDEGVVTLNASMVNIKEANYGEVFAARAFAQYKNDTTETKIIVYSVLDTAKYSDSFEGVIEDALTANVKDASETGYTNAVENGTKYTCYTVDQYAELKAIAQ